MRPKPPTSSLAPSLSRRFRAVAFLVTLLLFGVTGILRAQSATGILEGRVFEPDTGAYLEVYGPHTPDYARLRTITDFHPLWTFGVKGTF